MDDTYFELEYAANIKKIMTNGTYKETRNGNTLSLFGLNFKINMRNSDLFPILQGRKMYPKGVLGEFAAMLRGPKHVDDFKKFGCSYWEPWANKDGSLNVDYGNAWIDFNGVNQLEIVSDLLKNDPNNRRILISGWRPDLIPDQSLPCCHMLYQWRVDRNFLDMIWYQRSVDFMVGLPSDIILAAAWNIMLANEVGLKPGTIHFMLGDCHIYEEHFEAQEEYLKNLTKVWNNKEITLPTYCVTALRGQKIQDFIPNNLHLEYVKGPKVNLKVIE